ncbi:hypothetical protein HIM_08511 [Hirsutella minnesotensis 3608]|uniref:Uncharacterized protein n=1 Tax=Hirsutella minnesotensis 3608 TaxID=1043627 RepID=A0A0F7ZH56_9HYPO|nr:hypothetical protein HIM_08511 [Hirsutella minnesotensis 3608]
MALKSTSERIRLLALGHGAERRPVGCPTSPSLVPRRPPSPQQRASEKFVIAKHHKPTSDHARAPRTWPTTSQPASSTRTEALRARGIPVRRIPYLLPSASKDYSNDPRFYDCWSKLAPFSLTEYARVVQLDSDMLVLRNMDELMTLPLDDSAVSEAGDAAASLRKPHYPKDWVPDNCAFTFQHDDPETAQTHGIDPSVGPLGFMNGGLQVVNPSKVLYQQIIDHMEADAANMDFADQSLLSDLYRGRWVPLPYTYNALKTLRWPGVHDAIWRDDQVKNIHYILSPKPWDELDAQGQWTGTEESHRWWVDVNRDRKADERQRGIDDGF